MIRRLSNFITGSKEFLFRHAALRLVCELAVLLALLLLWLCSKNSEVAFIYNAF